MVNTNTKLIMYQICLWVRLHFSGIKTGIGKAHKNRTCNVDDLKKAKIVWATFLMLNIHNYFLFYIYLDCPGITKFKFSKNLTVTLIELSISTLRYKPADIYSNSICHKQNQYLLLKYHNLTLCERKKNFMRSGNYKKVLSFTNW